MTPPLPFTQPWADALRHAINDDLAFRSAAGEWVWPVILVLDAAPQFGYPEACAVRFDLRHGRCEHAALVPMDGIDAPFILRAPYKVWKKLMRGLADPVMAVAAGHVQLTGSLSTLLTHAGAAKALIACARAVPSHFPDEDA